MADKAPFLHLASDRDAAPRKRVEFQCPECVAADRPTGPLIEVVIEADLVAGEIVPTAKRFACLACHARGILTLI